LKQLSTIAQIEESINIGVNTENEIYIVFVEQKDNQIIAQKIFIVPNLELLD
jgi:hypothetical protein